MVCSPYTTMYTVNGLKLDVFSASFAKPFAFFAVKILTARFAKIHAKYARKKVQFLPVCSITA